MVYAVLRKALTFRRQKRTKQLGLARGMFALMDTDGSGAKLAMDEKAKFPAGRSLLIKFSKRDSLPNAQQSVEK